MSIDKITELKHKAAHQLAEMRRILDENETLTAEQAQEFDRREADLDSTNSTIDRLERVAGIAPEPNFTEARGLAFGDGEPVEIAEGVEVESTDEAAAFDRFLRSAGQDVEARATMKVGTDNVGGYLVGEEWSSDLIRSLQLQTALFDQATVYATSNGVPLHIPTVTTDETISLVAEEGSFGEVATTVGEVVLNAYKYGHIVKASTELVQDSLFDLSGFVRDQAARVIGNQVGAVLATANGSSKPTGINQCTVGVTAASTTATTADEVIDTQHSVAAPYRANAAWFVNDTWLKTVRKLKGSGSGDYLLQPGLSAGAPATLLGSPVFIEQLDAPAAGKVVAVYGDPSSFAIRRTPVSITVLNERYADTGHIGYKVELRLDSKIADSAGLRSLKQAAS